MGAGIGDGDSSESHDPGCGVCSRLLARTAAILGPAVADPVRRLSGNNLSQSCHLQAGTQQFGPPLVGVFADSPQYRGRSCRVNTIAAHINSQPRPQRAWLERESTGSTDFLVR